MEMITIAGRRAHVGWRVYDICRLWSCLDGTVNDLIAGDMEQ